MPAVDQVYRSVNSASYSATMMSVTDDPTEETCSVTWLVELVKLDAISRRTASTVDTTLSSKTAAFGERFTTSAYCYKLPNRTRPCASCSPAN